MIKYHTTSTFLISISIIVSLIGYGHSFLFAGLSGFGVGVIFLLNSNKFQQPLVWSKQKRGFLLLGILASIFVIGGSGVSLFMIDLNSGLKVVVQGLSLFAWLTFFHYRRAMRTEADDEKRANHRTYKIISLAYVTVSGLLTLFFLMPLRIVGRIEIIDGIPLTFLILQVGLLVWLIVSNKKSIEEPIWALPLGGLLVTDFYLVYFF